MKKKNTKFIIRCVVLILIIAFVFIIYSTLIAGHSSSRNKDISNYKISNNEINSAKDKIKEISEVKSIDIHTNNNSKIIKIVVVLEDDIAFDQIKNIANECLKNFSEENLSYYDFEFYVDTQKEESEIYPRIGYKDNLNSEFSW